MKKNLGTKWMAVLVATAMVAALATTAEARPGPGPRHGPPPAFHHHHHHHGGSFAGALVGTALAVGVLGALTSVAEPEPTVVVQQPVVYQSAPVVQQPVVVQSGGQQQVVYQPAPVVVQQPTVVYQTAPVVRYRYSSWW